MVRAGIRSMACVGAHRLRLGAFRWRRSERTVPFSGRKRWRDQPRTSASSGAGGGGATVANCCIFGAFFAIAPCGGRDEHAEDLLGGMGQLEWQCQKDRG